MKTVFRILVGLTVVLLQLPLHAQVQEDGKLHGRVNINLGLGPGGSLSPCLRTQGDQDLQIARDDCAETEGVLAWSKYFMRGGTQQIWARALIDLTLRVPMERGWADTTGGNSGLVLGNRNFFAEVGNFWGSKEVVWVGNRSYDYEDLWTLDLRILDQHGPGLGMNNIDLGWGTLGLAFFRVNSKNGGPSQDTLDLRWDRLPLFGGLLKFALLQTRTLSTDSKTGAKKYAPMTGTQLALIHRWDDEDSENKFFMQAGQGLYGGNDLVPFDQGRGSEFNNTGEERDPIWLDATLYHEERQALKRSRAYRIGNQYLLYPEFLPFSLHTAALYERVEFGGLHYEDEGLIFDRPRMETRAWILRPMWDITTRQSLALSHAAVLIQNGLGYHRRLLDGTLSESRKPVDRSLRRSEIAYIVRPLGWGGGTEAKLYAAYNEWNPETRRDVSRGPLQNKTHGWTGGLTMSLWW
ncbi:MAG TPA: carbohydrate porin [Oligoflexus sp.]|uniref:carbohydrate porin n=1 Tax=Oligoflexus sp. TaxID=1971216 RepID=UPI002D254076|nr:carbohydrate porin [Oligoflexus sp.]HYX36412.1 carbohydrate porin [Oligoflexus sp.]